MSLKKFYPLKQTSMSLNSTEGTTNSPSSAFYCPHMPNFSWDLNLSTLYWIMDAIGLIASPATILLNALAIVVMTRSKQLKKNSNILLSSLAATDLLVGAIVMPLSATIDILILSQVSLTQACMLDRLNVFFMFLLFLATLHHLTVIAWERYVAIQKWMDYKVLITSGRLKKLAIAAWFFALFQAVPGFIMTMVGVDVRIVEGWYTWCASIGAACLILITFFYQKVYLGTRQRDINEIGQVTATLVKAKLESKVAKTTALLTAALMFSFIPVFGFEILGNFFPVLHTSVALRFTDTMTQMNSLFNPLLYCYRDRRFRNALRELLGKRTKPQALHPAADAAQVRRKDPLDRAKQRNTENPTRRLARSASCNPPEVLDSFDGRPRQAVLKSLRPTSAPKLDTCSSSPDGLDRQQSSSIMITSATIHTESGAQRKARKRDNECSNHSTDNKPQDNARPIQNKSRSRSWDPITSIKTQRSNKRPKTAPENVMVPDEASLENELTTKF